MDLLPFLHLTLCLFSLCSGLSNWRPIFGPPPPLEISKGLGVGISPLLDLPTFHPPPPIPPLAILSSEQNTAFVRTVMVCFGNIKSMIGTLSYLEKANSLQQRVNCDAFSIDGLRYVIPPFPEIFLSFY